MEKRERQKAFFWVVSFGSCTSVIIHCVASILRQPQDKGMLRKEQLWLNEDFKLKTMFILYMCVHAYVHHSGRVDVKATSRADSLLPPCGS